MRILFLLIFSIGAKSQYSRENGTLFDFQIDTEGGDLLELMKQFMLSISYHRIVLLELEGTTEKSNMEALMTASAERGIPLSLASLEGTGQILKTFFQDTERQSIKCVLLCVFGVTQQLLKQIRNLSGDLHIAWVFLATSKDQAQSSLTFLTWMKDRVLLIHKTKSVTLETGFRRWSPDFGWTVDWSPWPPRDQEFSRTVLRGYRTDFLGQTLKVAAIKSLPFFDLGGPSIDRFVVQALAHKFNFRVDYATPADGYYGSEVDGEWTGVIGMVNKEEVDLGVGQLTWTAERSEAVDFSGPYAWDYVIFAVEAPQLVPKSYIILAPFEWAVWVCLIGSFAVVSLALFFLDHEKTSLSFITTFLYGSLLHQGSSFRHDSQPCIRMVISAWWLVAIVAFVSYSGVLISLLNVRSFSNVVDTRDKLAAAILQDKIRCGTPRGTSMTATIMGSDEGIMGLLRRQMEDHPELLQNNLNESLSLVVGESTGPHDPHYASLFTRIALEAQSLPFYNKVLLSKDFFYSCMYAVALRKGAVHRADFTRALGYLVESGLIKHWKKEVLQKHFFHFRHYLIDNKESLLYQKTTDFKAFALKDVIVSLRSMALGFCISIGLFLCEVMAHFILRATKRMTSVLTRGADDDATKNLPKSEKELQQNQVNKDTFTENFDFRKENVSIPFGSVFEQELRNAYAKGKSVYTKEKVGEEDNLSTRNISDKNVLNKGNTSGSLETEKVCSCEEEDKEKTMVHKKRKKIQ